MAVPEASSSMSPIMYTSLIEMYRNAVESYSKSDSKVFPQYEINFMTHHALAVLPLAVTVWESHLNEQILAMTPFLGYSVLSQSKELTDLVERADIKAKSVILPKLAYGETFDKSAQPYQDFIKLVDIRNSIVHFKPYNYPKKTINYLEDKRVTLIPEEGARYSWPLMLYSSESMRWAINTVCSMILELDKFSKQYRGESGISLFFKPISVERAKLIFEEFNVNPSNISKKYRN
ncbi:hypothetical protein [Priestia megaterium]|uniref:hypothetical protein n=1 Tax=Priestia megaterium TaxID=1404 RepID=UPI00196A2E2F|nr:hypothetical protein [Priestia megaterium]QSF41539.1 hypothetical protein ICR96_13045 [Priestia megaterium]